MKRDFVFFDGAIGHILQKHGLKSGQRPDIMNMTAPEIVELNQRRYVDAGSNIVMTNTFGANARALKNTGYTVEEVIHAAVAITKRATSGKALTALDMGPIGEFMRPFGSLSFEESYELYRQQAVAAAKEGVDLVAVETMSDLYELKAAVRAVREHTNLPVFATMTFDKSGRTFTGCRPESFAITAERLGAAAIGINCSLAPVEIFAIAEKLVGNTTLPVIIKPNAGLPNSVTGEYDIDAEEFARQMAAYAALGVKIIGGCCGTTPDYIEALRRVYSSLTPVCLQQEGGTRICTPMQTTVLEGEALTAPVASIAEPEAIINSAVEQADNGSTVVKIGFPKGLSPESAGHIIRSVQAQTDMPLYLAAEEAAVLQAALHEIPGSPAIASASLSRETLLSLAARYGAVAL